MPGNVRHVVGIALVVIGVALLIVASFLAYEELVTKVSIPQPPSLESVLYVLAVVTYKVAFLAVIAWSGAILITRGLSALS
ncbi:MAG: hypothetical protein L7H10_04850 [Vulcanisaeta sp.]|jgi:hypothetical protein|nr:hypothetical protein [Vulcanisaeta sp.]MCG2870064.1 hypothetical protein [Vulcanisaeta sp.]MCG2886692.1 hypothetical protein [Vulcanisaeta sp.]